MWYSIDFFALALQILPTFLRMPNTAALTRVMLAPLKGIYISWFQVRNANIFNLQHNGQVCYLRKALNDTYDPDLRRIYIGEGNIYETLYIYTEAEAQNVYTGTEAEDQVQYLRTESETADTGLDFIVWVPADVYSLHIHGLKAMVDFFKAGGKRYNIFINE